MNTRAEKSFKITRIGWIKLCRSLSWNYVIYMYSQLRYSVSNRFHSVVYCVYWLELRSHNRKRTRCVVTYAQEFWEFKSLLYFKCVRVSWLRSEVLHLCLGDGGFNSRPPRFRMQLGESRSLSHTAYRVTKKTGTLFVRLNFIRLNFIKYCIIWYTSFNWKLTHSIQSSLAHRSVASVGIWLEDFEISSD